MMMPRDGMNGQKPRVTYFEKWVDPVAVTRLEEEGSIDLIRQSYDDPEALNRDELAHAAAALRLVDKPGQQVQFIGRIGRILAHGYLHRWKAALLPCIGLPRRHCDHCAAKNGEK